MTWLPAAAGETPLERVLSTTPELYERFRDFAVHATTTDLVDPVLLELIRLRYAQMHDVASELQLRYQEAVGAGLTEEKIAALEDYGSSDLFTERERDCLEFAEQISLDPHLVSEEHFARAGRDLTDEEMLAFVYACTTLEGMARLRAILEVEPVFDGITVVAAPEPDRGAFY